MSPNEIVSAVPNLGDFLITKESNTVVAGNSEPNLFSIVDNEGTFSKVNITKTDTYVSNTDPIPVSSIVMNTEPHSVLIFNNAQSFSETHITESDFELVASSVSLFRPETTTITEVASEINTVIFNNEEMLIKSKRSNVTADLISLNPAPALHSFMENVDITQIVDFGSLLNAATSYNENSDLSMLYSETTDIFSNQWPSHTYAITDAAVAAPCKPAMTVEIIITETDATTVNDVICSPVPLLVSEMTTVTTTSQNNNEMSNFSLLTMEKFTTLKLLPPPYSSIGSDVTAIADRHETAHISTKGMCDSGPTDDETAHISTKDMRDSGPTKITTELNHSSGGFPATAEAMWCALSSATCTTEAIASQTASLAIMPPQENSTTQSSTGDTSVVFFPLPDDMSVQDAATHVSINMATLVSLSILGDNSTPLLTVDEVTKCPTPKSNFICTDTDATVTAAHETEHISTALISNKMYSGPTAEIVNSSVLIGAFLDEAMCCALSSATCTTEAMASQTASLAIMPPQEDSTMTQSSTVGDVFFPLPEGTLRNAVYIHSNILVNLVGDETDMRTTMAPCVALTDVLANANGCKTAVTDAVMTDNHYDDDDSSFLNDVIYTENEINTLNVSVDDYTMKEDLFM